MDQRIGRRSSSGPSLYLRAAAAVAAGCILTFFATQIYLSHTTRLPLKIGMIAVIVAIGVAGILALLETDEEPAPAERLYTADEVAALLAAVQDGRLVAATPRTCKFCGGEHPEATGVDGSRYHRRCFRDAYQQGKT